jgi:hypothetical protein
MNKNCYSKLGNGCINQTVALTSNTKFIKALDPIYLYNYTNNVLEYPGHENDTFFKSKLKPNLVDKIIDKKDDNKECKTCG